MNLPQFRASAWRVRSWRMEPSEKWSINMDGALLRHGPSVISSLRVDGWFCLHRTVRDSGPKRGGFDPAEWNLPWFRASAWMVPPNILFRPTASRKHQRAGILPQVVVDRVCGQSARARLQYTPKRCLRPKDGRGCKSPLQRPAAPIK